MWDCYEAAFTWDTAACGFATGLLAFCYVRRRTLHLKLVVYPPPRAGGTVPTSSDLTTYDESALLERLTNGLVRRNQEVVFLVGSPLSGRLQPDGPGVPSVEGVIDLVRSEFMGDPTQLDMFESHLDSASHKRYQAAFQFLLGRRGQPVANEIIRKAVLADRISGSLPVPEDSHGAHPNDDIFRQAENDAKSWFLSPGMESLGKLVSEYPNRFGRRILTTNFDPLIEVSIRQAGGKFYRTILQADGNLAQTEAPGCHIVHLHGYWYGADTLHTASQLEQYRPHLKQSLANLIRNRLVVICGYGGWDDIFTSALIDVVRDDAASPELLWTLFAQQGGIDAALLQALEPGISRSRLTLYSGVDCHHFLPNLYAAWRTLEPVSAVETAGQSNPVKASPSVRQEIDIFTRGQVVVSGRDEDRPPGVDICVGREAELKLLSVSKAQAVFINGVGGQGKSTVAARYFTEAQANGTFDYYVWRDCKEESERFENQLVDVVDHLSGGRVPAESMAKQTTSAIIEILMNVIGDQRILFVFDNVDHYVNLETGELLGAPALLASSFLGSTRRSRVMFTCRPTVRDERALALTCRLEGLSLDAAIRLFKERGTSSEPDEVRDAHQLTDGHAFWLDLLAVQVAKRASIQ